MTITDVRSNDVLCETPVAPVISFVIPVLNDADFMKRLLDTISVTAAGQETEVIVVDGGSEDHTVAIARDAGATVVVSPQGRGIQLARGCAVARGRWLWMLHADSLPTLAAMDSILRIRDVGWGRCDVEFDMPEFRYRMLAWFMNHRSALTSMCTGDQGIFVCRSLLLCIGGVPEQPLMEDVELCRRLRRHSRAVRVRQVITTSARRWQAKGFVRTVVAMWIYRAAYFLGAHPTRLAQRYYRSAIHDE